MQSKKAKSKLPKQNKTKEARKSRQQHSRIKHHE
jgi:hypothetical protein